MRLDVARQPRIGVDQPGAPDVVFAVEDREVAKTGLGQQDSKCQAAGTGTDDADRQICSSDLQALPTVDDQFRTGDE